MAEIHQIKEPIAHSIIIEDSEKTLLLGEPARTVLLVKEVENKATLIVTERLGEDGKAIQLQNSGTHIQWRYVGDASWTNLIALEDITGPSPTLETYREYVGWAKDPEYGAFEVVCLNANSPLYLGDIEWEPSGPTDMMGTTSTDKFTIYTFLVENQCATDGVTGLKINRADVLDARTIILSFTGGLGTIGGLFKLVIYPGDFASSPI